MTPGLRRAFRAARRGVGWAWPESALGVDLQLPDGRVFTDHRSAPGDDPVARVLDAAEATGGCLSVTSIPERRGPLLRWIPRLAAVDLAHGELPGTGAHVRGNRAPRPIERLNRAPWFRARTGRPLIILKAATSLDGRIATRAGISQWITGPRARFWGRSLRAEADGIAVGVQTVIADDPLLTTRRVGARDPRRIVFDASLRTPLDARLVRESRRIPTQIVTRNDAPPARADALRAQGVEILGVRAGNDGRPSVSAAVDQWTRAGWTCVLVEGGAELAGSFVDAGVVDYVCWFVAPRVLGGRGAVSAIGGVGAVRPDDALRLERPEVRRLGADLLVEGWVVRD